MHWKMLRELKFKRHCRRYQDDVYRFARSILGNPTDAEDATQEVLLRLWKHLDSIRGSDARPWLLRTTRNHCIDQLRRRPSQLLDSGEEALASFPAPEIDDPIKAANRADFRKQIDRALATLPENLRSVFVLYEVNGLHYREVAETLGIPLNSVKVYLSRARARLKKHFTMHQPCLEN